MSYSQVRASGGGVYVIFRVLPQGHTKINSENIYSENIMYYAGIRSVQKSPVYIKQIVTWQ